MWECIAKALLPVAKHTAALRISMWVCVRTDDLDWRRRASQTANPIPTYTERRIIVCVVSKGREWRQVQQPERLVQIQSHSLLPNGRRREERIKVYLQGTCWLNNSAVSSTSRETKQRTECIARIWVVLDPIKFIEFRLPVSKSSLRNSRYLSCVTKQSVDHSSKRTGEKVLNPAISDSEAELANWLKSIHPQRKPATHWAEPATHTV